MVQNAAETETLADANELPVDDSELPTIPDVEVEEAWSYWLFNDIPTIFRQAPVRPDFIHLFILSKRITVVYAKLTT